jgi:hypothetical protein
VRILAGGWGRPRWLCLSFFTTRSHTYHTHSTQQNNQTAQNKQPKSSQPPPPQNKQTNQKARLFARLFADRRAAPRRHRGQLDRRLHRGLFSGRLPRALPRPRAHQQRGCEEGGGGGGGAVVVGIEVEDETTCSIGSAQRHTKKNRPHCKPLTLLEQHSTKPKQKRPDRPRVRPRRLGQHRAPPAAVVGRALRHDEPHGLFGGVDRAHAQVAVPGQARARRCLARARDLPVRGGGLRTAGLRMGCYRADCEWAVVYRAARGGGFLRKAVFFPRTHTPLQRSGEAKTARQHTNQKQSQPNPNNQTTKTKNAAPRATAARRTCSAPCFICRRRARSTIWSPTRGAARRSSRRCVRAGGRFVCECGLFPRVPGKAVV